MRRLKLVLGALALVVTSLAAFAGPAMANDIDCHEVRWDDDVIRCEGGDYYVPYNYDYYNDYGFYSPYIYSPYIYSPIINDFGCWQLEADGEWDWEC